jgi:hypothetical protein
MLSILTFLDRLSMVAGMERMRVYHPETNEPFDVPVAKGAQLVLNNGWSQTPLDAEAEPAVKTVPRASPRRRQAPKPEFEEADLGVPSASWLNDEEAS